jgi:hypothetical protein
MRVLVMAPFERGRGQGGSLRATAIAERLEERGVEVDWQVVRRRALNRAAKLRAARRGVPVLAALYDPPAVVTGAPDAMLVAHSYLLPAVRGVSRATPTIVDFHNLEWRHLLDGAHAGPAASVRRQWARHQVRLMHRLETSAVATAGLSLFVSESERKWARSAAPDRDTLLAPSTMPAAEARVASRIAAARDPQPGELAYVGTLTFPTNVASLERFLHRDWPAMRDRAPGLRLSVAGACEPAVCDRLGRHPGVTPLGFVEDLAPLLSRCQAVAMPFDGVAGTSLRSIFYALAGLPVIGSPNAFRGLGFTAGIVAGSPTDWADAVTGDGRAQADAVARAAQGSARRLQDDREPWDGVVAALEAMATTPDRRAAAATVPA